MKRTVISLGAGREPVRLGRQVQTGALELEPEKHLMRNVSFISRGPAIGHGFDIDDTALEQVVRAIRAKKGRKVKVRFTHPDGGLFFSGRDGVEVLLGTARNPQLSDGQVRGDIHFGPYAKSVPGLGDVEEYLFAIAREDPSLIGMSIVFEPGKPAERTDEAGRSLPPAARIEDVLAVDFVGDPAANPGGLLRQKVNNSGSDPAAVAGAKEADEGARAGASAGREEPPQYQGVNIMNERQKKYLLSLPLAANPAGAAGLQEIVEKLTDQQKAFYEELAEPAEPARGEPARAPAGGSDEPHPPAVDPAETLKAERDRTTEITACGLRHGIDMEIINRHIALGTEVGEFRKIVLETIAPAHAPLPLGGGRQTAEIHVGPDRNLTSLRPAIADAICLRAGLTLEKPHERAEEFRHLSLENIGRSWLASLGVPDALQLPRTRVANLVLSRRQLLNQYPQAGQLAQSTGDFDYILEDAMGKSLRRSYQDGRPTWPRWARRTTAPDFKDIKRIALSEAPSLTVLPEGAEIQYVTLGEGREVYALVTYAQGIKFTWKAFINDDLQAFSRIPQLQASACWRLEDATAYAILTANAAMSDGVALFHSSHGNLASGSDVGAPTVATLGAATSAMMVQRGPKNAALLNLIPRALIVPAALYTVTRQLIISSVDPAKQNATPNPFKNDLDIIPYGLLDATSTTAWYAVASSNDIDTVEVCFLEGEPQPVLAQEQVFDTLDRKFSVRHTVAAKAIDWRGMYKNPGA